MSLTQNITTTAAIERVIADCLIGRDECKGVSVDPLSGVVTAHFKDGHSFQIVAIRTAAPALTTDQVWEAYRQLEDAALQTLRHRAIRSLQNEEGHGISSSDVNHAAVGILQHSWIVLDAAGRAVNWHEDEDVASRMAERYDGGHVVRGSHIR
jgi:hypothetical protein